jgi:hypothetical protein
MQRERERVRQVIDGHLVDQGCTMTPQIQYVDNSIEMNLVEHP